MRTAYNLLKQAGRQQNSTRTAAAAAAPKNWHGSVYPTKHHGGEGSVEKCSSYVSGGWAGGGAEAGPSYLSEARAWRRPCLHSGRAASLCYAWLHPIGWLEPCFGRSHAQHLLLGVSLDGHIALGVRVAGLWAREEG